MKHGPLLFLGVLAAVMASWLISVVAPHFQFGNQELVNVPNVGIDYPLDRAGAAKQGAEVYRAQGCVYCHTQQVLQPPLRSVLTLADAGTNAPAVTEALMKLHLGFDDASAAALVKQTPAVILPSAGAVQALEVTKLLTNAGARVEARVANLGPDLSRGWGGRRTVSRDYLRDRPVMLGQVRFGPDLANVGARLPDTVRLLRKLYNARVDMPGSTMPRYPYLFEQRMLRPGQVPSTNALWLPPEFAPPPGTEIIPKPEALQLVAYLLSLKSEPSFYEVFPPQPARTNALSAGVTDTNTVATGTNAPPPGTNAAPGATNPPPVPPATNAPPSE